MSDHASPDDDGAPVQRQVSAADGSPLHSAAASSVFNWRGAPGSTSTSTTTADEQEPADSEPATNHPTTTGEEETMATRKKAGAKRARKANKGGSPQLQICSVLLQNGDLSREAIAEACGDLTAPQISSALNNSKNAARIVFIEPDTYRLTKEGKAWIAATTGDAPTEEATPEAQRRRVMARRGKAHRRQRTATEKDTTPPPDEGGPTFRCGVMSDGCFFITKDEVSIELDAEEHKQMLHYLERMAVAA